MTVANTGTDSVWRVLFYCKCSAARLHKQRPAYTIYI